MKKSTGIVRRLDKLGRYVLPKELRNTLGFDVGDPVECFVDDDAIILQRYRKKGDYEAQIDRIMEDIREDNSLTPEKKKHSLNNLETAKKLLS